MTGKELFNKMSEGEYRDLQFLEFVKLMQSIPWTSTGANIETTYPMDKYGDEII